MKNVVHIAGSRVHLRDRDLIGEGGEGRVYRVGDAAVKVFTVPDAERARKLRDFPSQLPSRVIAPRDLVTDARGMVIGYSMRAVADGIELHRFASRQWRAGKVGHAGVLDVFRELTDVVDGLHARGVVVGDLNDGNVLATPPTRSADAWTPWLIDADSMQFGPHRCVVAHERFLDPRLFGVDLSRQAALSRESDWYALAVLLFGCLLYVHPFGGSHPSFGTLLRRAEARCSVLRAGVKLPAAAMRPDILPDDALAWFERVFERDVRERTSAAVLNARFTLCSCGVEHARTSCPACTTRVVLPAARAHGKLRVTRVFSVPRGRIVAAAFDASLRYAWEEDGALFREDGTVVARRESAGGRRYFDDPNRIVRIAGSATWLGAAGRFTKVVGERVIDSLPIGRARGELAGDVSVGGLVHVDGDALVRAESGTRAGKVLEGQTHVRVGASVGLAFYRASALAVGFVFDPRRGPLRQIEAFPHLAGKLVGWSAVFDDAHVLVTLATEERGRLRYVAHLVDASGELVATDDSDAGGVLAPSLAGRALASGNVLAATEDDGLVLLRPDLQSRHLVRVRVFTDARDLVSPEAELVVGPGGSAFVVTHDAITHLTFTP